MRSRIGNRPTADNMIRPSVSALGRVGKDHPVLGQVAGLVSNNPELLPPAFIAGMSLPFHQTPTAICSSYLLQ